jgi:putative ABC transport system substrate-binding protein
MAGHKVGFFHNGRRDSFQEHHEAFLGGLHGLVERGSVEIIDSWGGGETRAQALQEPIGRLAESGVHVIVAAGGPPSAVAAKEATKQKQIPVVFMSVADPVGLGLVKSLESPGTNMTGIAGLTSELDEARLDLLRSIVAGGKLPTRIGVLNNKNRPNLDKQYETLAATARRWNLTLVRQDVDEEGEIEAAFESFQSAADAVLVTADSYFNDYRNEIVRLAKGLPAIYQWREFVLAGGLMSFGPNVFEAYTLVGEYAGRILRGESPSTLQVALPSRFELVINLRLAYEQGFRIPALLLTQAEIIQ